jgi:ribosomal protein S12 methylthiotransferase accessory factor
MLEDMGKEVYVAVYDQLGATACRILVPGYSEVYPGRRPDLGQHQQGAAVPQADILNLHRLDDAAPGSAA